VVDLANLPMDAREPRGVWGARGLVGSVGFLCLLVLGVDGGFHNALVGPGALSTRGGGGGRGARGYGRVDEFPVGFFVGGSSLVDMNGLYVRQDHADPMLPHAIQLHYKNSHGWSINYVNAQAEGYPAQGGKDTEWLFVDPTMVDRFATQVTHIDCICTPSTRSAPIWLALGVCATTASLEQQLTPPGGLWFHFFLFHWGAGPVVSSRRRQIVGTPAPRAAQWADGLPRGRQGAHAAGRGGVLGAGRARASDSGDSGGQGGATPIHTPPP